VAKDHGVMTFLFSVGRQRCKGLRERSFLVRDPSQQGLSPEYRGVLQTKSHLADGEVEHVRLQSPPVHERGDQRGVIVEPRQPLRPGNLSS
jgi:hypothetical protein